MVSRNKFRKKIEARCIVIAAGAGSFVPRKLPLKNLENLENKNILYAIRNKSELIERIRSQAKRR